MKNQSYLNKYFLNIFVGFGLFMLSFLAYGGLNSVNQAVSDSTITTQVKAKYLQSPLLSVFNISVETNNGVVKLSGLVDSDAQYERAIVLAENTDGVKNVDTQDLKTKSSAQPVADTVITAKVKGLLLKNKLVSDENEANPWPIHVETQNGVVYLTGAVDSEAQKNRVIKTAKLVDGVKSVKADFTIKK